MTLKSSVHAFRLRVPSPRSAPSSQRRLPHASWPPRGSPPTRPPPGLCTACSPTGAERVPRPLRPGLEFYNHRRPHLGHRTRGRTPADLFWEAAGKRYDDQA